MSKRPKILIPEYNVPKTYLKALDLVGLDYECQIPTPNFDNFNGLLLPGGGDVFPFFYNGNVKFSNANLLKDAVEFKAISYFYQKDLPILGVCRGLQLLNVFFGGTLKNVNFHQGKSKSDVYHDLIPPKNGFLKRMTGANSNHVQCVDKLCENARDVCFCTDGTVEGFCISDSVLAVQFHPERMGLSAILTVYGEFAKKVKSRFKFQYLQP